MFKRISKTVFFHIAFVCLIQAFVPGLSSASTRTVGDDGYVTAFNWFGAEESSDADETAYIRMISPKNGDVLPAGKNVIVRYEMNPGSKGDHFHYFLDGAQIASWRARKGTLDFGVLKPGKHTVTFKIATTAHIETGVEASVTFTVK